MNINKQLSALSIHPQSEYDGAMLSWFNSLYNIDPNINLKLFSSCCDILNINKRFSVLPIYEAKYQYGNFFVWDILSLELCISFPNVNKIFYFQNNNIPWIKAFNINYQYWSQLFDNPKVDIITDDMTTKELFDLAWKQIRTIDITSEALYEIV